MYRFSFLLFAAIMLSCNSNSKTDKSGQNQTAKSSAAVGKTYPVLTQEIMMDVWDNCEMLDYLFHDLPFSMSQDEEASIRTNLTYIGKQEVGPIPTDAKPIARQFYQISGDIKYEADIYFDEKYQFYVFYVDGKKAYANRMNENGVKFFQNMISQAMKASGQMNQ